MLELKFCKAVTNDVFLLVSSKSFGRQSRHQYKAFYRLVLTSQGALAVPREIRALVCSG